MLYTLLLFGIFKLYTILLHTWKKNVSIMKYILERPSLLESNSSEHTLNMGIFVNRYQSYRVMAFIACVVLVYNTPDHSNPVPSSIPLSLFSYLFLFPTGPHFILMSFPHPEFAYEDACDTCQSGTFCLTRWPPVPFTFQKLIWTFVYFS